MRSLLRAPYLALAIILTFSIGGCATLQKVLSAEQFATASVANPVTPDRLNAVENTIIIAFAALNAYRQACIKGAADVNCRANIGKIQVYTRKIPPLLAQVRVFVKTNDQVNAVIVYNQIVALIATFKSVAAAAGVSTGG